MADVKGTTNDEAVALNLEKLTLKKDEFKIVSMNMRDAETG